MSLIDWPLSWFDFFASVFACEATWWRAYVVHRSFSFLLAIRAKEGRTLRLDDAFNFAFMARKTVLALAQVNSMLILIASILVQCVSVGAIAQR